MLVIGLTGGIASGKTTITNFLKKNKFVVHDSDSVIKNIYSEPRPKFLSYLKKINLKNSIKDNKVDKKTIREEIFTNAEKRKLLERYLHTKVKKSRDVFLKKNRQKKTEIVFLDIPLLFENKLENICNYTILFYAPLKIRKQRAIRRKDMKKTTLNKIVKSQLTDNFKKKKADFIIKTSTSKSWSFNKTMKAIALIKKNQNA